MDPTPPFPLGKLLVAIGLALIVLGVVVTVVGGRFPGLGRLPGDLTFRRGDLTVHVPIATSLLLSVLLSLALLLFRR